MSSKIIVATKKGWMSKCRRECDVIFLSFGYVDLNKDFRNKILRYGCFKSNIHTAQNYVSISTTEQRIFELFVAKDVKFKAQVFHIDLLVGIPDYSNLKPYKNCATKKEKKFSFAKEIRA